MRGRGLSRPLPPGQVPDFGVHLLGRRPAAQAWESRWVAWPDFRLPRDPADLRSALEDVLERAGRQRVELACRGGHGRTGTALACLAVLDGLPADRAVGYVREHHRRRRRPTGARAPVGRWSAAQLSPG